MDKRLVVMVSSTTYDLPTHRQQVMEACIKQKMFPNMMDHLPPSDTTAIAASMRMVDESDVYVGVFAHRYGHVPKGHKISITEMEYNRAIERRIPRLIFLMGAEHPVLARDIEKGRGASRIDKLRKRLSQEQVVSFFNSPSDLRAEVINGLAALPGSASTTTTKLWTPAVLYPLRKARYFAGREDLLNNLSAWAVAANESDRVIALVAAAGTGKTAVAEQVLSRLPREGPFGVFVWSFEDNPQIEAFLSAACEYFVGETPSDSGGLLDRLHRRLRADNLPHLFILDGLETFQATSTNAHSQGELVEPLMRRFLDWLAAGVDTRAKALITSRLPLSDLEANMDNGFRAVELADLDEADARTVLCRWSVKGTSRSLNALAESVHRHALTLDVLGSYLATFHNGDVAMAPSFDSEFHADTNPNAMKLQKVLTDYAKKLTERERDLLARLSVFSRGVGSDTIGYLIEAGGEAAGKLAGCGQRDVLKLLERLRRLGLLLRFNSEGPPTFTAHPFLRVHFEKLLGSSARVQVHEAVRSKLARELLPLPGELPTAPVELDRYERLIEMSRLAGRTQEACDLFRSALGGYTHLGRVVGDYSRGRRIVSSFSPDGSPENIATTLSNPDRARLAGVWGLFAKHSGDMPVARCAVRCPV